MWYRKVLSYEKKERKTRKYYENKIALVSRASDMSEPCRAILSPPPPPPPPLTSDQYKIPNKLRFQLFDNDVPS